MMMFRVLEWSGLLKIIEDEMPIEVPQQVKPDKVQGTQVLEVVPESKVVGMTVAGQTVEEKPKFIRHKKDDNIEVIGKQKALFGEDINITQFKNIKEKRELKQKVIAMFSGEMFRSILQPRLIDKNIRLDKLDREQTNHNSVEGMKERAAKFAKKSIDVLSTFPSTITMIYTKMLTKEGDKVYDPFTGHNSRAADVLALGRKYYGYDIHTFPLEFTAKGCSIFDEKDYELNLGSSESCKYENESMDFSLTCPPYGDVEQYNKIYDEHKDGDLSSKDYEEFLPVYKKCLAEVFRVLKHGAYFVIVVGDMHRGGKLIRFSDDTVKICEELGFISHDENIYNRGSNIGGDLNYKQFILVSKRLPTIHEYILVFKKP